MIELFNGKPTVFTRVLELPQTPTGYGQHSVHHIDGDLTINFGFNRLTGEGEESCTIRFDWCATFAFLNLDECPNLIPPTQNCIYELPQIEIRKRAFRVFWFWLDCTEEAFVCTSNGIEIEIKKAQIGR